SCAASRDQRPPPSTDGVATNSKAKAAHAQSHGSLALVWLSRLWSGWRSALIVVKPETVIGWHRQGFQWYWTWKIRHTQLGRPRVPIEIRDLIRTMSRDNATYVDLSFMLRNQAGLATVQCW